MMRILIFLTTNFLLFIIGNFATVLAQESAKFAIPDSFGTPTQIIANVNELQRAVKNAKNGDVLQLKAGTYALTETLVIPDGVKLTLIGSSSSNKEETRLVSSGKMRVLRLGEDEEATLADLSLEAPDWQTLDSRGGNVTAYRCRIIGSKKPTIRTYGSAVFKECELVSRDRGDAAVFYNAFELEACDVSGEIEVQHEKIFPATIKKCKIHDSQFNGVSFQACNLRNAHAELAVQETEIYDCGSTGIRIEGYWQGTDQKRCEITDCEIYNCAFAGISATYRAEALIRDCEIRSCRGKNDSKGHGLYGNAHAQITLENVEFIDCDTGVTITDNAKIEIQSVVVNQCNEGVWLWNASQMNATKLTFDHIADIAWTMGENCRLTLNGQTTDVAQANKEANKNAPPKTVSTVEELTKTIQHAIDGTVIRLARGRYELDDDLWISNDKKVSLIGATGDMNDVHLITENQTCIQVFEANVELTDLTLETSGSASAFEVSKGAATLTRCRINGGNYDAVSASSGGQLTLKNCEINGMENGAIDAYSQASVRAEDCDIMGSVQLNGAESSTFKSCKIHASDSDGIDVSGKYQETDEPVCNIVDCEIYGCDMAGVRAGHRAQVMINGGEIRYCEYDGIIVRENARVTISDLKISSCEDGISVDDGGKCEATNLTFTNVDDEWLIYDAAGTVTHNGRRMTNDD